VSSLAAALAAIAGRQPDLALLDVNLSGERVYPAADELRARKVPFVLMTGYNIATIEPRFAAAPHREKPFAMSGLAPSRAFLLTGDF